ncbi:MAG: hypothetical protein R2685_07955 [Candidatus Nitrosocosmicus sp.]|nr:hypothetical protein [Candidatus Nitrosocosmicus sp.]
MTTRHNYHRLRFKKNKNKDKRGSKVQILEKAITKPNEICICPLSTKIISNGQIIIPIEIRAFSRYCPAHKKGGGSKQ